MIYAKVTQLERVLHKYAYEKTRIVVDIPQKFRSSESQGRPGTSNDYIHRPTKSHTHTPTKGRGMTKLNTS